MINVDEDKGFCELAGSGHDLLQDVANIAAIKAGCAAALASVGATEEDADDAE